MTRPDGRPVVLNADLVATIEPGRPTTICLVDGVAIAVQESPDELVNLIRSHRAAILAAADEAALSSVSARPEARRPHLRSVPSPPS